MQERYIYPPGLQPPQIHSPTLTGSQPTVDQTSPNPSSQARSILQGSHHNFAELRSVASNNKMTGDSIKKGSVRQFSTCVGCGGQIHDQFILRVAPNLEWHAACLKCNECQMFLDENCTCFVRDGKTFCKKDYLRLFGTKCEKCCRSFGKTDFVMRAKNKIFHLDCFRCVACEKQLIPGDEFALRREGLFCKEDHQVEVHPGGGGPGSNTVSPIPPDSGRQSSIQVDMKINSSMTKDSLENNNNNTILGLQGGGTAGQQMHLMHNTSNSSEDNSEAPCDLSDDDMSVVDTTDGDSMNSNAMEVNGVLMVKDGRRKSGMKKASDRKGARARTVLSEKQLNILKTCYSANPRPDALMKEQLVEMTALSPRVIRVWFQNKRCKDKKIQIRMQEKQIQRECDGRKIGYGPMHGIPMVASSPVRHDSPVGPGMIGSSDIQSYDPPWKALSDFALHTDLDRLNPNTPHFQHLVNQMHGYPSDIGPDGLHGGPLGPPPPPPGEIPFHHGGPGAHMNLTPPPQPLPGLPGGPPNGPPGLQGPPPNENGGMYQPPDLPFMDGPGGCPPLGPDIPVDSRDSPGPGMLPPTEAI